MAKRYMPLPVNTVNSKRFKVEVTPRKNGFSVNINSQVNAKAVITRSEWDDDDDNDLLVQALSQVEQKVTICQSNREFAVPNPPSTSSQMPNMSESFTGFAKGVCEKTSTQMFVAHGQNCPETKKDNDPFDDDEDDFLLSQYDMVEKLAQIEKQKEIRSQANKAVPSTSKEASKGEFKMPAPLSQRQEETSMILPSQMTVPDEARQKMQQRKQLALEKRMKFLESRIDKLEAEKKKLETSADLSMQKYQARENEIVSLKYDLKQAKSTLDRLRQEKLKDTEKINKEWMSRMADLENQLKKAQFELEQKNAEIMNVKIKSSKSLSKIETEAVKSMTSSFDNHLNCESFCYIPSQSITPNPKLFRDIDRNVIFKNEICSTEYDTLVLGLSKVFISSDSDMNLIQNLILTIKVTLKQIYNFVLRLPKTDKLEYQIVPSAEFEHLAETIKQPVIPCEMHSNEQPSIYDCTANLKNEKIVTARRCLAIVSEMCKCKGFVKVLINHDMKFLGKLTKIVEIIGNSDRYAEFSALMTTITTIALNIYSTFESLPQNLINQLFMMIKMIIHCRIINITTLHKISELLYTIGRSKNADILKLFCVNNCDMIEKSDLPNGIIRFNLRACALQVYGACVEASIHYNWPLDKSKSTVIAEIISNIAHFIICCEDLNVVWVRKPVPGHETSVCPCIPKLICGLIVLLHTLLSEFVLKPSVVDMRTICYIAKISVSLLSRSFEQYDRLEIEILKFGSGSFNDARVCFKETVTILNKFKTQFGFEKKHVEALQILQGPKILMEYEREDDDPIEVISHSLDASEEFKKGIPD